MSNRGWFKQGNPGGPGRGNTTLVKRARDYPQKINDDYAEVRQRLTDWAVKQVEEMPETMTMDQARGLFKVLNLRSQLHADGEHLTRYLMGIATMRVKMVSKQGDDVIGQMCAYFLSKGYRIHPNTLRYYVAAGKKFGYNVQLFDRWLRSGRTPKKHFDIITVTRAHEDPEVLGPEEFARVIENEVERAAMKTAKIAEPTQRHELQLILTEAALEARDTLLEKEVVDEDTGEVTGWEILPDEEMKAKFKTFVMNLNCMACGSPPPVGGANDPHHVDSGHGMAKKGSDWTQIPLCRKCHTLCESIPATEFQRKTGIHLGAAVGRVLHIWLSGQDVPGLTTG